MAFIYKRDGSKKYWISYTDADGLRKQESLKTPNKAIANEKLNEIRYRLERGELNLRVRSENVAVGDYISDYLIYCETNHAPQTLALEKIVLQKHFAAFCAEHSVRALSHIIPTTLEKYKKWRQASAGPAMINRELGIFKAMLNRAVSEGRLISNPLRDAAGKNLVKKLPEVQAKKRFLDREEIQRLLKAAEDQPLWRNIIGVALTSGLRRAEVQHLIWDNVDFKRRILTVGNHEGFTTKNRKERGINMNESLVKILSGIERRGQYVFGAKNGEKPFTAHFNQKFNEIVKKAKIKGITFHDLRHTFASLLVQAGHSLPVVKEFMGHSSINITMIYAHTNEKQKQEAVASLELLPV